MSNEKQVLVPEVLIKENLVKGIRAIRFDYKNNPEKETFLYRILQQVGFERYDLFEQAKAVFIEPESKNEPKFLNVSMGYDTDRINDPHVHILMQSDDVGSENGLGHDQNGLGGVYYQGDDNQYNSTLTKSFDSKYNILLSASNSTELMMIYYVMRGLIIAMVDDFDLNGFKKLKVSGAGLTPQQQIADKFYLKSIFLSFSYDSTIPRFWKNNFGKSITLHEKLSTVEVTQDQLLKQTCEPALAIVEDQDGNELAREEILSGGSKVITVTAGSEILRTYPYDSIFTAQSTSYNDRDDKWQWDNVYKPEINSWDVNIDWVTPKLDPNDFTKILRGSNPDGSGNNIFGNKERFTNLNGNAPSGFDSIVDHYTGLIWDKSNFTGFSVTYGSALNQIDTFDGGRWYLPNIKVLESILDYPINSQSGSYSPFFLGFAPTTSLTDSTAFWTSTHAQFSSSNYVLVYKPSYSTSSLKSTSFIGYNAGSALADVIIVRKGFEYNSLTKQMDLIQ